MAPYIRLVETCCFYIMLMCGTAPVNAPAVRGFKLRKGTVGRYGATRRRQSHKSILSDKFNFLCELFHILRRVLYRIHRRRRPLYHTSFNFIRTLRNDKNSIFTHTNTRARHRSGLEIHLQFDCRFPSLKLSYVYVHCTYINIILSFFSLSSSFSAHF